MDILKDNIKVDWSEKISIGHLYREPGLPFTYRRYNYHSPKFRRIMIDHGFVHVASRDDHGVLVSVWENSDLGETYEYIEVPEFSVDERKTIILNKLSEKKEE